MVAIIEELCPENKRARANKVPATGARVFERRAWMEKRSSPSGVSEP
jgi:hypothetical protein